MVLLSTGPAISGSVGQAPSTNNSADVLKVQQLLNKAGAALKEDGSCGPRTIAAIKSYQKNFMSVPDGRIAAGGTTWKHLVEGKLKVKAAEPLVLLPQLCGGGYYSYSSADRQYGTAACIKALREIVAEFHKANPTVEVGIGDISMAQGGVMSGHASHRTGTNIDIRPLRSDKRNAPVTISDPNYSRDLTKALVKIVVAHRNVKGVLFNDTQISGVTRYAGHDNHLHVSMRE